MKSIHFCGVAIIFLLLNCSTYGRIQQTNYKSTFNNRLPVVLNLPFPFNGTLEINEKKITMQSLRGRKVILDLFSSDCSICFASMPKLDSLARQFNEIDFILVGKLDNKIKGFYERFSKRKNFQLPIAYDSVIFKKIEIPAFPFYIWLDEKGIVKGLSHHDEINAENLKRFQNGGIIEGELSTFTQQQFDHEQPFLLFGNGGPDNAYLYRSVMAPYENGQPTRWPPDFNSYEELPVFHALGNPLQTLFRLAYFGTSLRNRTDSTYSTCWPFILQLDEAGKFTSRIDMEKRWSYSFSTGDGSPARTLAKRMLRSELEGYFGVKGEIVQMPMPCWVLQRTAEWDSTRESRVVATESFGVNINGVFIKNAKITALLFALDNYLPGNTSLPLINETGIAGQVKISLDVDMTSLNEIRMGLEKIGLRLVQKDRLMNVIVLRPSL